MIPAIFQYCTVGTLDSIPNTLNNVQGPVSVVVIRWGAPRESNIFGIGEGQVETSYAVLSHLIELRHSHIHMDRPLSPKPWSIFPT
jgi:hypothetical protein